MYFSLAQQVFFYFIYRLNEGFASSLDVIIVQYLHPERQLETQLLTTRKDQVMFADVNDSRWPLNRYVESPAEIEQKTYDVVITHFKAVFLIRMVMSAMTAPTFYKGINYYLTANSYQTVTPDDLHAGFQRAVDEDIPERNINIAALMTPWENLPGYPILTLRQENSRLVLSQEGFTTTHDDLFIIPIFYITASDPDFTTATFRFMMTTREVEIPQWEVGDWILLNHRNYGLYLSNYDDALWDLIIATLLEDIEAIPFESRGLLFGDFNTMITQGHNVSSTIFLRLSMTLQNENEVNVWDRAQPGLTRITNRLRGTVLLDDHLSYLRTLMAPLHERMLNDESFNSELSEHVRRLSCQSGVQECLDNALSEMIVAMENNEVTTSMCSGFMTANEAIWMHFWNVAIQSTGSARDEILNHLSCTSNVELLTFYLNSALNMTNGLTIDQRELIINRAYQANFVGYDLIFGFVIEHHAFIHSE